jgi:pyruvate dehydrogenase E2 component (dihydrolipoamide acetyltransferase)
MADSEIILPKVGETTSRVTVLHWLKAEGDAVRQGEPLLEVETDKATLEIEAFRDGVLDRILVPEGAQAEAMDVLALLRSEDDGDVGAAGERPLAAAPDTRADVSPQRPPAMSPLARRMAVDLGVDLAAVQGTGSRGMIRAADVRRTALRSESRGGPTSGSRVGRVVASPKARRLAREHGVDLERLTASGVDGMVSASDVLAAKPSASAVEAALEKIPLSRLRRVVAERMSESKQTVPHFYVMVDVDMTQVQLLRRHCVEALAWDEPPTYTDVIVRACAVAIAAMPEANVQYWERGLARRSTVDIGIATAVEDGLLVLVLRETDQLNLRTVAKLSRAQQTRARLGRLHSADIGEKSMVVSNLGMHGVDAFAAIIDPPNPMILAVGRVSDRVVPVEGLPAVRPICTLTLSVDHRALDGVQAAAFLRRVKTELEVPSGIIGEEHGDENHAADRT